MDRKFAILLSVILASGCAATDNGDYAATDSEDFEVTESEDNMIEEPPKGDTLYDMPASNEPVIENGGVEPTFAEVDANEDGEISKEEAENYEAVAELFPFVDEDTNGVLSEVEFNDLKE